MKLINKIDSFQDNKTVRLICVMLSILLCIISIISTSYFAFFSWELITDHYKFDHSEYIFWIVILCSCLINILCVIYLATVFFNELLCLIKNKGIHGNICETVDKTPPTFVTTLKNKFLRVVTKVLLIILCVYMIMFSFISNVFNYIFLGSIAPIISGILPIAVTVLNIYSVVLIYRRAISKSFKQ